jgi:hypothetical protein
MRYDGDQPVGMTCHGSDSTMTAMVPRHMANADREIWPWLAAMIIPSVRRMSPVFDELPSSLERQKPVICGVWQISHRSITEPHAVEQLSCLDML